MGTAQYALNNTIHAALKNTPAKLLLGIDRRNHSDATLSAFIKQLIKIDTDFEKEREASKDAAKAVMNKLKEYNAEYYNLRHRKPTSYREGEYVLIRDLQPKPGENKKLKPSYKGPYVVTRKLKNNRYVVEDIPGFNITARPYNSILSSDKLKPWVKPPS